MKRTIHEIEKISWSDRPLLFQPDDSFDKILIFSLRMLGPIKDAQLSALRFVISPQEPISRYLIEHEDNILSITMPGELLLIESLP